MKASIKQQAEVDLARRHFLGAVKYVAAISVVALSGKSAVSVASSGLMSPASEAAGGYRETGHIRNYYASARY